MSCSGDCGLARAVLFDCHCISVANFESWGMLLSAVRSAWTVLRPPEEFAREGRAMLDAITPLGSGVLPPGTRIFGWPR
jgi:hypothetical protein